MKRAIEKVWPELVLRGALLVCGVATIITSGLSLKQVEDNDNSSAPQQLNDIFKEVTGVNYNTLIRNTSSAAWIGLVIACFVLAYEIFWIVIRMVNVGCINNNIKIFLGIDVGVSLIVLVLFVVAGSLAAYAASEWSKLVNNDLFFGDKTLLKTRDLLAALAGTSLFGALFVAVLAVWLILSIRKGCTSKTTA